MTKISSFFRELSEDNSAISSMLQPDLIAFVQNFPTIVSPDSCEFVINMCLFYFNCYTSKHGIAGLVSDKSHLECILKVVNSILNFSPLTPQLEFFNDFSAGFKKVVDIKEDEETKAEDAEIANGEEEEGEEDKEVIVTNKETETLQNNPAYRQWLLRARGVVGVLKMLEKIS